MIERFYELGKYHDYKREKTKKRTKEKSQELFLYGVYIRVYFICFFFFFFLFFSYLFSAFDFLFLLTGFDGEPKKKVSQSISGFFTKAKAKEKRKEKSAKEKKFVSGGGRVLFCLYVCVCV